MLKIPIGLLALGLAAKAQSPAPAVILYDGPSRTMAAGAMGAEYVRNLLGHFGLSGEALPVDRYQPGMLARYSAGFYLATESRKAPPALLHDVRTSRRPFVWMGRQVEQLLADSKTSERLGLRAPAGTDRLPFRVQYKGHTFAADQGELSRLMAEGPARVLAQAVLPGAGTRPYAVASGPFWYFADVPFLAATEGSRYLVFCDLLHDVLGMDHPGPARAMVRIEDISADAEENDLRTVADLLAARKIPFTIATIPLYRNPSTNVELRLSDRKRIVDAVRYMVSKGGTPVMHGWSHQYRSATGDDYELWDEIENHAIAGDSEAEVTRRLNDGIAELVGNGIYPWAFETPHYAASPLDYRTMARIFRLFYERDMVQPDVNSIQYFPYPVKDVYGRQVIPENLGYLPLEKPDPAVLIDNARAMRVVRDGLASFYFHPFLDANLLARTVDGIRALGYTFTGIREFQGGFQAPRYALRTAPGTVSLSGGGEHWRLRRFDASGNVVGEQRSASTVTGGVEVAVDVPTGGWSVVDWIEEQAAPRAAAVNNLGNKRYGQPGDAWILRVPGTTGPAANNQQSYRAVLETFGFSPRFLPLEEFRQAPANGILVVPEAAGQRATEAQRGEILRYLAAGGSVVVEGEQPWLAPLGLRWEPWRIPVSEAAETLHPGETFNWQPEQLVARGKAPAGTHILLEDTETGQPLAFCGTHGSGRYLYLAAALDPHTPDGVSRYPYLPGYLAEAFGLRQRLQSPHLEVYFDPGYRQNISLDRLAAFWKRSGVRTLYVAAWHFYGKYTFDYATLIRTCHRNGIAVYPWFMFPEVTQKMWDDHPEWRERAANGKEGRPGWRHLLNFANPDCFEAAMDWMRQFLRAYDWDGVNLAELNFDAVMGDYLDPARFVPMNPDVRRRFRPEAGFDPALLFDPRSPYFHRKNPKALERFLQFREDLVTDWHRKVLAELQLLAKERQWEIIVTAMDSLHSSFVRPALGVNTARIAALMQEFDFTLQVEDPAEHWAGPPGRYHRFAETYRKLVPDPKRLMFDINVVEDRETGNTTLPSPVAMGTELARTVAAGASVSGRVAIYAEHTIRAQDWPLLTAALASGAVVQEDQAGYRVRSAGGFLQTFQSGSQRLDGAYWPVHPSGGILLPAGEHRVATGSRLEQIFSRGKTSAKLIDTSADLIDGQTGPSGLSVQYDSPGRAVFVLDRHPQAILVDGRRLESQGEAAGSYWYVTAPAGRHLLRVVTDTQAGVLLNFWSWFSASAIAAVASLSIVGMIGVYLLLRIQARQS